MKKLSMIFIAVTILMGLFFVTRFYVQSRYNLLKPTSYHYSDFRKKPPVIIDKARIFAIDGEDYYELIGGIGDYDILYLPSGPPAYIFDKNGNLIDYSLDTGDDPDFLNKWHIEQGKYITLEELDRLHQ